MKKVIVSGAGGFVGKWLIQELASHDLDITIIDKPSHKNNPIANLPKQVKEVVYNDFSDMNSLLEQITERNFDVFFHLAWGGPNGSANRSNYDLQIPNIKYSLNAISIAKKLGCTKFIASGTKVELECYDYLMQDFAEAEQVMHYASAKIAAHMFTKIEAQKLGIEHIWAYLPSIYGIGDKSESFITATVRKMLRNEHMAFTTGEQFHDFVYISDIVHALYLLSLHGKKNNSYYLGSGQPLKLKKFIEKIRDAVDPKIKLYMGEIPFNALYSSSSLFDCRKLIADTGYKPQVSFDEGILLIVKWLKEQI